MARGKRFDKKTATTFQVVHRPQNDPRIHDESAPQVLLNQTSGPSKIRHLDDLSSEFGSEVGDIRENEGEAANYGIYFDDTEYDYMQHLREPGLGGETVFVPATTTPQNKAKDRKKQVPLEEQLEKLDQENNTRAMVDPDLLPTQNLPKLSYQAQQDVPDYIAGFQPDMDPRLREVLEALEDDAYVEDNDDVFKELAQDGEQLTEREFEDTYYDDDWEDESWEDDGYESDRTVKPVEGDEAPVEGAEKPNPEAGAPEGAAASAHDWMEQFKKFKKDQKPLRKAPAARSELQSSILSTSTMGGRRKKRKGALTSTSTYSMTSSSLVRTEQLTLLDARFDKIEEEYNEEDEYGDDMSSVSGLSAVSTASSITGPMREDFNSILDEFLGETSSASQPRRGKGKKKVRDPQAGLAQLDEIRRGLGPARVRSHA